MRPELVRAALERDALAPHGHLPPRSARRTRITAVTTTIMSSAIPAATRKARSNPGRQRVAVSRRLPPGRRVRGACC
jgi:hypothetical protein